jgi:hypothetical protein
MVVDHETLRRWMLAEGLWSRQRKRKKHCQRRERKAHFGELVQLDGSFHDWFEGRGARGCLMHMVDDATNESLARMGKEESIWAAAGVLRAWMEKHGVPQALYTDWKNVYKRKADAGRAVAGESSAHAVWADVSEAGYPDHCCQFSPGQGASGTDPRRASGSVHKEAEAEEDRQLRSGQRVSGKRVSARRFAREAAKPEDYHRRKPSARELREIFRLETERSISNDWVIRQEGRSLQLQPSPRCYGPTQSKALVCEWEDGRMEVYYRGERMAFTELHEPIRKASEPLSPAVRAIVVRKAKKDHPWRQSYQSMRPQVSNQAIVARLVGMRTYASP